MHSIDQSSETRTDSGVSGALRVVVCVAQLEQSSDHLQQGAKGKQHSDRHYDNRNDANVAQVLVTARARPEGVASVGRL